MNLSNMLRAPLFIAALALAAAPSLAGCGGGVEGNYKLDKAEMKKSMEAEIAKMPKEQQGFAQLAMAMIDGMEMSMELQPGGKLKTKSTTPGFGKDKPAKTEEKNGTWKAEGDAVTIETEGKPVKCTKGAGKLTCQGDKKGEPALVFVKG